MTNAERLVDYINESDTDGLQAFLQELTYKERRKLMPAIRKLEDSYLTQGAVRMQSLPHYNGLLMIAQLVCMTRTEFSRAWTSWESFLFAYESGLFDWFKPSWLSALVNDPEARFGWWDMDYEWTWKLDQEGIIQAEPALWAHRLAMGLIGGRGKEQFFQPEILEKPAVLETQIWHLFAYESSIPFQDSSKIINAPAGAQGNIWKYSLARLAREGKIDRLRLLGECLHGSTRMLSRDLLRWYVDLFDYLEPQLEEIRALQTALFGTFYSNESKAINMALKYLKKIAGARDFAVDDFFAQSKALFSHDTQSIVRSALILSDKLARSNAMAHPQLCLAVMQTFLLPEANLQARAAKILLRYADREDEAFKNELAMYQDQFLGEARLLLADLVEIDSAVGEEDFEQLAELPPLLDPARAIQIPDRLEDFVFLLSQYMDTEAMEATDILLASCHHWMPRLEGEELILLEPAFKQIVSQMRRKGNLKHLTGCFLLGCIIPLAQNYPRDGRGILKLYETEFEEAPFRYRGSQLLELKEIRAINKSPIFQLYVLFCQRILESIEAGAKLPILSTPTHAPYYLDPVILVERIAQYELAKQSLPIIDLQIAISRTVLAASSPELLDSLPQYFQEERLRWLRFLLDPKAQAQGPFTHEAIWQLAMLCKTGRVDRVALQDPPNAQLPSEAWTGDFDWYIESKYVGAYHPFPSMGKEKHQNRITRLVVQCDFELIEPDLDPLRFVWRFAREMVGAGEKSCKLYEYLKIPMDKSGYWWDLSFGVEEIGFYYSMVPHRPEPLMGQLVRGVFGGYGKPSEKLVQALLNTLAEQRRPLGPMSHLLLGLSLLAPSAHNRLEAIEIVLQKLDHQLLDPQQLGYVLGQIESQAFAPLKRLTDTLSARLPELLQRHANSLWICLSEMLAQFKPNHLPKSPKKLLEILLEVLMVIPVSPSEKKIKKQLNSLKTRKSLQKLIEKILAHLAR